MQTHKLARMQTDRQTERGRKAVQAVGRAGRHEQTDTRRRHTGRQAGGHTVTRVDRETGKQADRHGQTDTDMGQTDGQTDMHAAGEHTVTRIDMQRDQQAGRQTLDTDTKTDRRARNHR